MRHVVEVQSATDAFDAVGGRVQTWSTTDTVRAVVRPASTFEQQAFAHLVGGITHVIDLRAGVTITKANRLKYGTRILEIRGVMQPDERGRFLRVQATEVVTGGGGTDGE
jgi:SPP1 family predicted phage head-tail adaptor